MAMQADAKKNSLQLRVLFLKGAVFLRVHLDHCRRGRLELLRVVWSREEFGR